MNFGSTKTKLDHIIEHGLRRIDDAVEGVIDRHTSIEDITIRMSRAIELAGERMAEEVRNIYPDPRVSPEEHRQEQKRRNMEACRMAENAAMAPRPNWGVLDAIPRDYMEAQRQRLTGLLGSNL